MQAMYKARHAKPTKHRVTLPMLVLIAALCVTILVFPTTASGETTTPDAVSGMRAALSQFVGSETYSIVPSTQNGGSVTPSVSDCAAGKTVTFTVQADKGFETASIAAITSGGDTLEVKRVNDGTYSFVMPTQGVVIDVAFQYIRA